MEELISKCGINCLECSAYKATIQNSDDLRKKTAEEWSKQFGTQFEYKSINCLGCQSNDEDKLFRHTKTCAIRLCGIDKNYTTCAECSDFGCSKVQEVWKYDNTLKQRLESLRK